MMKSVRSFPFVLVLCALLAAGCGRLQDVRVTSARFVRAVPDGSSALSLSVDLGIDNPSVAFKLSQLTAQVRLEGRDILALDAEPFSVAARSEAVYPVTMHGRVAGEFTLFRLFGLLRDGVGADALTVSLHGRLTLPLGFGKDIELEDVPVRTLLERMNAIEPNDDDKK